QRARGMGSIALYHKGLYALKARHDSATVQSVIASLSKSRPQAAQILEGLLSAASKRSAQIEALEKLRPLARVDRYSSMTPPNGPNIDEALGAALVADGRANDAIKVCGEELNDRPRRAASLLGLLRAQEAACDKAGARVTRAELTKMWAHADPEVRAKLMARAE